MAWTWYRTDGTIKSAGAQGSPGPIGPTGVLTLNDVEDAAAGIEPMLSLPGNISTGVGTPTRVAFWQTSNSLGSDAQLFWDNVNKRLGIGVGAATPASPLHVIENGPAPIITETYGVSGDSEFQGRAARGTFASPAAVQQSDILSQLSGSGHDGTSFGTATYIAAIADETWTPTKHGAYWAIETTAIGGLLPQERIRVGSSGRVGVGGILLTSLFNVGGTDQFQVDSNGNIVKLRNVTTSFPAANAAGVLHNDATGTLTWAAALSKVVVVTAAGTTTYTPTAGLSAIRVICVGGGGAGGGSVGSVTNGAFGPGGGGGGYVEKLIVGPAASYSITVGAGGTGTLGGNGNNGVATTFAALLAANAGLGGTVDGGGATANVQPGGNGAILATGGDVNTGGMPGFPGLRTNQTNGSSGAGGGGLYGMGGGNPRTSSVDGQAGKSAGAGGSGSADTGNTTHTGGAGAAGIIIIYEYS